MLRMVAAEIRLPAFAIGGISRDNLDEVLAAGFTRIAVGGAVVGVDEPALAAEELLDGLARMPQAAEDCEGPGDDRAAIALERTF